MIVVCSVTIAILSGFVAITSLTSELRNNQTSKLTKMGLATLTAHVLITALAIALIAGQVVNSGRNAVRAKILAEWMSVPIVDPVIGVVVDFSVLSNRTREKLELMRPLVLEVGLDYGPLVRLPEVHIPSNALGVNGPQEGARIPLKDLFPRFPETVGELVGHSLKFRENDIRPFAVIQELRLYSHLEARRPFLRLSMNQHERVGTYYWRIWYPAQVQRMPSLHESYRNHGPFVFLPELLPRESPLR